MNISENPENSRRKIEEKQMKTKKDPTNDSGYTLK